MKKPKSITSIVTLLICALLTACASPGKSEPWYLGTFTGEMPDAGGKNLIKVTCTSEATCEVHFLNPTAKSPEIAKTTTSKAIGIELQNNNLLSGREILKTDPAQYQNRHEGALLTQLKPIFESTAKFTDCKSIGDMLSFCLLSGGEIRKPIPILAMITMKGSCGKSAFCAYYFMPLAKDQK
jgi:hypothetical protein